MSDNDEAYISSMKAFYANAIKFFEDSKEDYKQAEALLKDIKEHTNFKTIFESRHKDSLGLINECKSFSKLVRHIIENYPELINKFSLSLRTANEELMKISGIEKSGNFGSNNLRLKHKENIFNFKVDEKHDLKNIDKEVHKIVLEVAEIIHFDYRLEIMLNNMINKYRDTLLGDVELILDLETLPTQVFPSNFVESMNSLISWWKQYIQELRQIQKHLITAIELDKSVTKEIKHLIKGLDPEHKKRMIVLNFGVKMITLAITNFEPISGSIMFVHDIHQEIKDVRKLLKEI